MHLWNDGKPDPDGLGRGHISLWSDLSSRHTSVNFNFVHSGEQGVLWPVQEATIQSGGVIDRYGDPYLLAGICEGVPEATPASSAAGTAAQNTGRSDAVVAVARNFSRAGVEGLHSALEGVNSLERMTW